MPRLPRNCVGSVDGVHCRVAVGRSQRVWRTTGGQFTYWSAFEVLEAALASVPSMCVAGRHLQTWLLDNLCSLRGRKLCSLLCMAKLVPCHSHSQTAISWRALGKRAKVHQEVALPALKASRWEKADWSLLSWGWGKGCKRAIVSETSNYWVFTVYWALC
jgi:hypothetical protein